jgi:glycosyltransferase involved in cell wall biosynthesis
MRITMILPADALLGGIRVLAAYAQRLAQRGHQVTVVQPRHPRPTIREILRTLRRTRKWPKAPDGGPSYFDNITVLPPIAGLYGANYPASSKAGSFRRIKVPHPGPVTAAEIPDGDLVLASWWETVEWVWALPPSKGTKVHFMQDYEIWGGQVERVDATCRLPIPKIVITRWVANLLSSRFGQEPVAHVPNSVDTSLFNAPRRGKQKVPTVGLTYAPMRNKGSDISIQAIERARKQVPNLKVIAFGANAPTADLPLPSDAEFFFRVPDRELPTLYAACDAWLFGTRIAGFGLPILEAMACRTPVIGTPAGAAPELLSHGGGIQVPMEDSEAMAEAIVHLCLLPEPRWRDYSDAAHLTAASYTWDDATDRFEAALEQIRTGTAPGVLEQIPTGPASPVTPRAARFGSRHVEGEVA